MKQGNAHSVDCNGWQGYETPCKPKYPIVGPANGVYSLWTFSGVRNEAAKMNGDFSRRYHFTIRTRTEIPLNL